MTIIPPEFMPAIIADPADDTRRLGLADWLDEHATTVQCSGCEGTGRTGGSMHFLGRESSESKPVSVECRVCAGSGWVSDGRRERAEFIRVQCEIAGTKNPHPPVDDEDRKIIRRLNELMEREEKLWNNVALPMSSNNIGFEFALYVLETRIRQNENNNKWLIIRRGFVDEIRCRFEAFRTHGPKVCQTQPVTKVVLTDKIPACTRHRSGGMSHRYSWFTEPHQNSTNQQSVLPPDFLPPGKHRWNHKTAEDANTALSDALIQWARGIK